MKMKYELGMLIVLLLVFVIVYFIGPPFPKQSVGEAGEKAPYQEKPAAAPTQGEAPQVSAQSGKVTFEIIRPEETPAPDEDAIEIEPGPEETAEPEELPEIEPVPDEVTISIQYWDFDPKTITVPEGTTVVWRNDDSDRAHTVVSYTRAFYSGRMLPGDEYSHTFTKEGAYDYYDGIFRSVRATVVVTGEANG